MGIGVITDGLALTLETSGLEASHVDRPPDSAERKNGPTVWIP